MADAETNWIDFYISLNPVVQTGIWAGVALAALIVLRDPIKHLADEVARRVRAGDKVSTPWLSLERRTELEKLERAERSPVPASPADEHTSFDLTRQPKTPEEWNGYRQGIYQKNYGLFLVHVIQPSKIPNQKYDIFILVIGHKGSRFLDIIKAEFFMGPHWGNRIFSETPRDGLIGLKTSAFGPFLCVCKIHLKRADGRPSESIMVYRYIDFEMGEEK